MKTNASFFSRFRLPQKFVILGLIAIAMTLLPIYQFFRVTQEQVRVAERELAGFQPAKDVLTLIKPLQVHRGLNASALGGNKELEKQIPDARKNVETAIAALDADIKAINDMSIQERWGKITKEWKNLLTDLEGNNLSAANSFAKHTQLVMDALWILEGISDHYEISFDNNPEYHFLIRAAYAGIPQMTEYTAQMRGFGSGMLSQAASLREAKKSIENARSNANLEKLATMSNFVRSFMTITNDSLAKMAQKNAGLQTVLEPLALKAVAATNQALNLAEKEILNSDSLSYPAPSYFQAVTAVMEEQLGLGDAVVAVLGDSFRSNVANLRQQQFQIAAAMFLLIIFGSIMAYMIARTITNPIEHLEDVMARLEQGDSSVRANLDTRDEIGELARQFDSMVEQRESVANRIREENEQLNESIINLLHGVAKLSQKDLTAKVFVAEDITGAVADALNMLSLETAKVLQQVTDISADVTSASLRVKQQSDTVLITARTEREQVMKTSEELQVAADGMARIEKLAEIANAAADNAIRTTQVALSTVSATVTGINSTRETIRETEKRIKRLGERSQEISSVVGIINTIAERTHILALNASMHAASAGEAGRGFAVVAEEVQRLAESSRQATAQIATLVNNIQMETADTVTTMNSAISQVVDGSRLAEQAGEQMKLTQTTTADLVDSVRQIAASSHEQAKLSNELLVRSAEIRKSTEKTSQELTEQSVETENLVEYARALLGLVRVFKLPA